MIIPDHITESDFKAALRACRDIVGKEWLFDRPASVDLYRDAFSPLKDTPEEYLPGAAVAPASVEEVQAIVRVANKYRLPLYPVSTGKNVGYGGSAPTYSGSVVLDLKRMNRILDVDVSNATCLVEPGVSYFDMYHFLKDHDIPLWIDCPDPGWGSMIGNAVDHGGGYTMPQFRNHFEAHCGMEVVLPSGELLRTGMGAIPNAKTWQQYKMGCGPVSDGLFGQSNLGVVTKMGFWMMPEPEAFLRGRIDVFNYDDLNGLVEALNYLENARIVTGFPDLSSPLLGAPPVGQVQLLFEGLMNYDFGEKHAQLRDSAVLGYSPELQKMARDESIPYWQVWLSFYGPEEVIQSQWKAAQRIMGKHVKSFSAEIIDATALPIKHEQAEQFHEPELGVPSLRAFSIGARTRFNPTPSEGHMWFSPIIPRTGDAIIEANRVFGEVAREAGMPLFRTFTLPTCFWERAFIFIMATPVTGDAETNQRYVDGFKKLIHVGGEHGWGEYRTAPVFQKSVMDVYSYNDHALHRFNNTLKDAIDPNGILAPGRYNIWPSHLRG